MDEKKQPTAKEPKLKEYLVLKQFTSGAGVHNPPQTVSLDPKSANTKLLLNTKHIK